VRRFTGVPCSLLEPLRARAAGAGLYRSAHVEGEAAAMAAGSWLAGAPAAVLMQNSGLGNAVNPLASLLVPYRIPALFVVSWRGEPGRPDALHHFPMGEATLGLLELFGVCPRVLREDSGLDALRDEAQGALAQRRVHALVVPRGLFAKEPPAAAADGSPVPRAHRSERRAPSVLCFDGRDLPTRGEAVRALTEAWGEMAVVSTTGYISRELSLLGPCDHHFYMQGSMGFALAVALGVALVQPERPLLVLDGDGALLMRLGSLATAGAQGPRGLLHVVLDNGTYGSTGAQPTVSGGVDLPAIALACGYRGAASCAGREGLAEAVRWARAFVGEGPALLRVSIDPREEAARERPERAPDEIADAFRGVLSGASGPGAAACA
jgi:phosphonopyruvate decarboxylase